MRLVICIVTAGLIQASVSHMSSSGNTEVEFGHDAQYWCELSDATGVLQVTWQRLYGDEAVENLATYSKHFGLQVNAPYVGKVEFMKASLHSTAIAVRNVTWDDDGCYICSFNIYPDGSQRKQMCLTVKGVSEVKTHVHVSGGAQEGSEKMEVVFSCSATGKPAPTVDWESPVDDASQQPSTTTTVSNGDGTFNSSSSFTVKVAHGQRGHVECMLNRGTTGERREIIPFPMHDGKNMTEKHKEENKKDGEAQPQAVTALIVCVVVFPTCAAMFAAFWLKRLKDKGRRGLV